MTDGVEVRLGANTEPATSGLAAATSKIQSQLESIKSSLASFGEKNAGVTAEAIKNNANLSRSFVELKGSMQGGFNAIAGTVARVRGIVGTLALALGGGILFKGAIDDMLHFEEEVRTLQITMGMTDERASHMAVALKLAGSSADTFAGMAFKVERMLKSQGEEFDRLGVKVKDSNGGYLSTEEILQNVYSRMQDFKAGTDQNLFALSMVGRSAKEFASEMSRLNAVQERATELQREFGIEMSPAKQAQIEAYRIEFNAFKVGLEAIGEKIGTAVLPSLMSLAKYFSDVGPSAAQFIVNALKVVSAAIDTLATGAKQLSIQVGAAWQTIVDRTAMMVGAMSILFSEGWGAAAKYVEQENKRIVAAQLKANMEVLGMEVDLRKRLDALWNDKPIATGKSPMLPKSGNLNFTAPPKSGASDDRLATWRDELLQMQQAEGYFHEFSKAQEAAFWEAKLALVKGKGQEDVNLRRELNRLIFDDRKAAANEELAADLAKFQRMIDAANKDKDTQIGLAVARTAMIKATFGEESKEYERVLDEELKIRQAWVAKEAEIMKLRTKMAEAQAAHEIEIERLNADQELALRQITAQERFAIETQLEDRLYAQRLASLNNLRATLQAGTKEYVEVDAQIEKAEQEHQAKLTQIANQAELDRKQYALQAAQATQDAFATFLSDVAGRTKSFSQAFKDMITSITSELSKLASQQVAKQLLGPGTEGGGFLNNLFGKIFGGGAVGGKGANAGAAAADASLTQLSTAATTASTSLSAQLQTAVSTTATTMQSLLMTALESLATAANQAAAALMSIGPGTGLPGLPSPAGDMPGFDNPFLASFGIPFFADGSNYVPKTTLALVHQGEKIIPASMNRPGMGGGVTVQNVFNVPGPMDSRTQDQLAAKFYQSAVAATRKLS